MKPSKGDNLANRRFLQERENWYYKRGHIYFATLNPFRGSEQGGKRPVLVVQNDVGNYFASTLIVAPMTTKVYKKDDLPTHYLVKEVYGLREPSLVLLEQLRTIDKSRIIGYVGKLDKSDMDKIDTMIRTSLGMYLTRQRAEEKENGGDGDV